MQQQQEQIFLTQLDIINHTAWRRQKSHVMLLNKTMVAGTKEFLNLFVLLPSRECVTWWQQHANRGWQLSARILLHNLTMCSDLLLFFKVRLKQIQFQIQIQILFASNLNCSTIIFPRYLYHYTKSTSWRWMQTGGTYEGFCWKSVIISFFFWDMNV